nr:hypothetical protein CFP56_03681 [Quercus suber]
MTDTSAVLRQAAPLHQALLNRKHKYDNSKEGTVHASVVPMGDMADHFDVLHRPLFSISQQIAGNMMKKGPQTAGGAMAARRTKLKLR